MNDPILWLAITATTTWLVMAALLRSGLAWRIATDIPNQRSLHAQVIPRAGGVGLWLGSGLSAVILALSGGGLALPPLIGAGIGLAFGLGLISLLDDRHDLPARLRFAAHALAVMVWLVFAGGAPPWWLWLPAIPALIWLTNLYNFMDGADGLAGGMTVIGFTAYALMAHAAGDQGIHQLSLLVSGAALGFLAVNFHPARLFMGDAGSIPLGFLAGAIGWYGFIRGVWPAWFPWVVFAPFVVDATVTLLRRIRRGDKFWQAHREHYYQRLVRLGWGHRRTAVAEYGLMVVCAAVAVAMPSLPGWLALALAAGLAGLFVGLMRWVDRRWQTFQASPPATGSGMSGPG